MIQRQQNSKKVILFTIFLPTYHSLTSEKVTCIHEKESEVGGKCNMVKEKLIDTNA